MNPKLCEFLEISGTGILTIESRTLWMFGNFRYENFKKWIQNFANFWKFRVWKFSKLNPELYECLKILGTGILKIESGTLWIFGNFGYGNLKKLNPELFECLEILGTGILKIESGTLWIFGNFGYGNFKKLNPELYEFLETLFGHENFKNGIQNFMNVWKICLKLDLECRKSENLRRVLTNLSFGKFLKNYLEIIYKKIKFNKTI